jgi:hypothetical protein
MDHAFTVPFCFRAGQTARKLSPVGGSDILIWSWKLDEPCLRLPREALVPKVCVVEPD